MVECLREGDDETTAKWTYEWFGQFETNGYLFLKSGLMDSNHRTITLFE